MKKQNYSTPSILIIDMKTYGIMEIQGESRFRIDSEKDIYILDETEEDELIIDAKQYKIDLWGDDELSEDDY